MAPDDKILSQVEIDALLTKNAPKLKPKLPGSDAPPSVKPIELRDSEPDVPTMPPFQADTPPAPPPTAVKNAPQSDIVDELANLQKTVADLVEHVVKLASDVQRIDDLEEEIEQLAKMVKKASKKAVIVEEQINDTRYALEAVGQNKSDSLRDEFICSKCQSRKTVVFHVKCTTCGNESWMGWWPKTKKK